MMSSHSGFTISCLGWLSVVGLLASTASGQGLNQRSVLNVTENLIRKFSTSSNESSAVLTQSDFQRLLETATGHSRDFIRDVLVECHSKNCTGRTECPKISEIFQMVSRDDFLTAREFISALPLTLATLTSENCTQGIEDDVIHKLKHRRPSMGEAWGYSIGFASAIIMISNVGACLGPMIEKRFFKRLLQYLVALGAGSMASTGLLVLIPEAFEILPYEELSGYVWKASVAIASIYVFFCSERILKTCLQSKKKGDYTRTISIDVTSDDAPDNLPLKEITKTSENGHGPSHGHAHSDRKALAWMIMAGDAIHKFVDGLSIGAAFTEDITLGISISLAILCEELPHELADIAILIHSGMAIKRALVINFLSGCMVYLGIVLGVLLGSLLSSATTWVFAMAGGLFLFVPLSVMLPDMSAELDRLTAISPGEARVVAGLQFCGLIVGSGIIVVIINLSEFIVV